MAQEADNTKQVEVLKHYLACFISETATGDAEFDAAFDLSEQAKIILRRLADADRQDIAP